MTPTEQEIAFFREAKRIQEEWEPQWGDWYAIRVGKSLIDKWHIHLMRDEPTKLSRALNKSLGFVWLPRQGQLQEMLEERGHRWDVGKLPDSYTATIWNDDVDMECEGSTPSIALGKCLLEVLKEE